MSEGFVYLWHDTKRNKWYLGSHLGSPDDGYVGSNKRILNCYNARPETLRRRVLEHYSCIDNKTLKQREALWLQLIKPEELHGVKYYNCKRVAQGGSIVLDLPEDKREQHRQKAISNHKYRAAGRQRRQEQFIKEHGQEAWDKKMADQIHQMVLLRTPEQIEEGRAKGKATKLANGTWGKNDQLHTEESKQKQRDAAAKRRGLPSSRRGTTQTAEVKFKVKMNNPNRKAFFTPEGFFLSGEDYAKEVGRVCANSIRTVLQRNKVVINKRWALKSPLFDLCDVGKTPFDLGYRYETEGGEGEAYCHNLR